MGKATARFRRLPFVVGCAVFLLALGLYLGTLAPDVLPYDSGTLQAKSYLLGIGHPTGYPTYIVLGKLFTYLPVGNIAYRVNLSSAVYGAFAALFVYLTALRLLVYKNRSSRTTDIASAAVAALAFAAAPAFWSEAVVAEVYTLNILLVTASLYTLFLWREERRERYLLLAALLVGLSITAHMTSALLLPASLLFVALVDRRVLVRVGLLAKSAGMFILGLSPYLYLPLRASMDPPLNYGDPSDLSGFIFIISGGNFKGQMLAFGPEELTERIFFYLQQLADQFPLALFPLVLLGTWVLARRDRPAGVLLGALFTGYLAYALEYNISDIEPYFIQTYLLLALLVAVGLAFLLTFRPTARSLVPLTVLAVTGALLVHTAANYGAVDQSNNYEYRSLIETVATTAPQNATVLGHRETAVLDYMQRVENRRQDLTVVTVTADNAAPRAASALKDGPVHFVKPGIAATENLRNAGYNVSPLKGPVYKVRPVTGM